MNTLEQNPGKVGWGGVRVGRGRGHPCLMNAAPLVLPTFRNAKVLTRAIVDGSLRWYQAKARLGRGLRGGLFFMWKIRDALYDMTDTSSCLSSTALTWLNPGRNSHLPGTLEYRPSSPTSHSKQEPPPTPSGIQGLQGGRRLQNLFWLTTVLLLFSPSALGLAPFCTREVPTSCNF